ncbi:MAG TPA: hypothetical protein VG892_07710 [Terriglobales bacterium]|nr:hypothetical protein [Terriglobales bacterium]
MSEFWVGQKVVCIPNGWEWCSLWGAFVDVAMGRWKRDPHKGEICTISDLEVSADFGLVLFLNGYGQVSYIAQGFRPLDSKAIEIFRKIARDVTDGKKAEIRDPGHKVRT